MTSPETPANSFRRPQRARPLRRRDPRMLEDPAASSFSCAPPPPQVISYFNPLTNETLTHRTEVPVHEIGILFNYEIRHASDATWEETADEEGARAGGFLGRAEDYFAGLFGRDDDEGGGEEDGGVENEGGADGDENLLEVEERMASEIWKRLLDDKNMTWDWQEDCAGLAIEDDDTTQRLLSEEGTYREYANNNATDLDGELNIGIDLKDEGTNCESDNATDFDGELDINTDLEDASTNATELEGGGNEDILDTVDTLDTAGTMATFSGTKLLGLTYQPLDYVNIDGCIIPDSTCTSIRGQVSVAYAGMNEYGVVQTIIEQLRNGMDAGTFIPPGSPALNLEFQSAGGTSPSGGNGMIISLNTDRGTGRPEVEEEDALSRYGTLFVCLVGILGAGFLAATVVRYRKRKRRKLKEVNERSVEHSVDDYEAQLAMQESAERTDRESSQPDSPERECNRPRTPGAMQVELDVPRMDSPTDSHEVEVCLSGSNSF
mmetsp:Transcript_40856/g.87017  ORF Transcript_40856/g.87017 Transcript_40856/m.87017 type:complete len:492 (-) Transcript_40856:69-1544(-)